MRQIRWEVREVGGLIAVGGAERIDWRRRVCGIPLDGHFVLYVDHVQAGGVAAH